VNKYLQELKSLQLENESLKLTLDKVQVQLDTSLDAQVPVQLIINTID
jgi:hypothetical protein